MRQACSALALMALSAGGAGAQMGRDFVSVESCVGLSRIVHIGRVEKLEQIDYKTVLQHPENLGKQYRLVFSVAETIRGEAVKTLSLVIATQTARKLAYLHQRQIEVMLVGGPRPLDSYLSAAVGIEEQGKRVKGQWYQFRALDALPSEKEEGTRLIAESINIDSCFGRMFTADLAILQGRDQIVKRARAFARKYPALLKSTDLSVPNDFGRLVGYPDAFCAISLPVCPETEQTLLFLLKDPDLILGRIEPKDREGSRRQILVGALKALKPFPSEKNAVLVRTFANGDDPAREYGDLHFASPGYLRRTATELLRAWKMS